MADQPRHSRDGQIPAVQPVVGFLPSRPALDLIFCRNVLIYFDQETKVNVLNRLSEVIAGDGYLVLGAAETVVGVTGRFKTNAADLRGLYMPNPPLARPSVQGPGARYVRAASGRDALNDTNSRLQIKTPATGRVLLLGKARTFKPSFQTLPRSARAARSRGPTPFRCSFCRSRHWPAFCGACR